MPKPSRSMKIVRKMRPRADFEARTCNSREETINPLVLDFEDGFDFDSGSGGDGGEAERAAGVVAVVVLAEDLMDQIRSAVDDEVLFDELAGGVDASEELENAQAVESPVSRVDGAEDLDRAVFGSFVALLNGNAGSEFSLEVADVSGGDEQISGFDAEIEIAFGLFGEGDSQSQGLFFSGHDSTPVFGEAAHSRSGSTGKWDNTFSHPGLQFKSSEIFGNVEISFSSENRGESWPFL